jgi:hypothetical protein
MYIENLDEPFKQLALNNQKKNKAIIVMVSFIR